MLFIRFTASENRVLNFPLSGEKEAEIAVVTERSEPTTGDVYAISAYDLNFVQKFAHENELILQQIDQSLFAQMKGFPQFRSAALPLSPEDLAPSEDKAFYQVLVVDGLGISINEIIYRSAAWKTLYAKMNQGDVAFNIDFTASTPFVKLEKLLLNNNVSEKVLFGPVLLDSLLRYDFIVNESALSSLVHSHGETFPEQVSAVVDASWHVSEMQPLSLPELVEDPEMFEDRVADILGEAPFVLLNGVGDFSFNHIPKAFQVKLVTALRKAGFRVATMGNLGLDDEGVIDVSAMASSLGMLEIISKQASVVITTNSPSVAVAAKNDAPLIILSVGAKDGIYVTNPDNQKTVVVADERFFHNINKVTTEEVEALVEQWTSLDESSIVGHIKELIRD